MHMPVCYVTHHVRSGSFATIQQRHWYVRFAPGTRRIAVSQRMARRAITGQCRQYELESAHSVHELGLQGDRFADNPRPRAPTTKAYVAEQPAPPNTIVLPSTSW